MSADNFGEARRRESLNCLCVPSGARGRRSSHASKSVGAPSAAGSLAEGLRKLADAVENEPALLSLAAESMAVDFMAVGLIATQ